MKLKELTNKEHNLLDGIKFFDSITDTKPYYNEMIYLYGNRTLTKAVEELYNVNGLFGVGMLFDLKGGEWENLKNISDIIKENITLDTKVVINKTNVGNVNKTGNTTQENINTDFVNPYDSIDETQQNKNTKSDNYNNQENVKTDDTGKTETVYTGYNKEKIILLTNLFKNYPDYRYKIYNDIVNMLCLQIYDYNV